MSELLQKVIDWVSQLSPVRTVQPNETGALIRCGKYRKTLGPGLYLVLPVVYDIDKLIVTEQVVDLRAQSITTKDKKRLAVSGAIAYRICDTKKALYYVQDFDKSLQALSLGIIAHYINSHDSGECFNAQKIASDIKVKIRDEVTRKWGLQIISVWVTDVVEHNVLRVLSTESKQMLVPFTQE